MREIKKKEAMNEEETRDAKMREEEKKKKKTKREARERDKKRDEEKRKGKTHWLPTFERKKKYIFVT